ncbi:hypothetical protein FNYG_08114 [Fusarium nygamai]|uniref:Uncharacterized protein n=1 Tax=Gibberella nygamai TaxID=42673 RepID=A0A2K0W8I2_GIBNY|nr:hypothetical protein FNYG_08114 [Fusarium nygamai]
MGYGMLMSSCQTYISKVMPKNVRGLLLGLYVFDVSLGHLIAVAVVLPNTSEPSPNAYRIPLDKAMRSRNKLGTGNDESMLERIQTSLATEAVTEDAGECSGYTDCFKGTNLSQTAIIVWLNLIQQFVGMALWTNGAYFLTMAGMSAQYSNRRVPLGLVKCDPYLNLPKTSQYRHSARGYSLRPPPATPPAVTPPRHLLNITEELQEKIWRLALSEFTINRAVIEIQSSYDEWRKPEPEDPPGLNGLEPLYQERLIYAWRQTIRSPRRPVGLDVCRDSRRIMLSFFREFPRRCIRQLVQNDEGQDRFLDIDPSEGNLNIDLCNPDTAFTLC